MEPKWQPINQLPASVPATIRDWLTAEVSLTVRLRALGAFTIQILGEHWGQATHSESVLLGIHETAKTWQRDVALLVNNEPKVIAHTVIPEATLQALPELQHLGSRSLGDLIFQDLKGTRESLEFAFLSPEDKLFKLTDIFNPKTQLPTRRSLLTAKGYSLIVNELFI